jgi:hypothetical protein
MPGLLVGEARLGQRLVRGAERPESRLEGKHAVADDGGVLRAGPARSALGVHRGADRLQGSESISDPSPAVLIRRRLAQRIQGLREVIGAALDVVPASTRVIGGQSGRGFRDTHGVVEGRALRVSVDDPRPPAGLGCRAAAC